MPTANFSHSRFPLLIPTSYVLNSPSHQYFKKARHIFDGPLDFPFRDTFETHPK